MTGRIDDRKIQIVLGTLLRTGVLIAAAVAAIGGMLYLVRHGGSSADYRTFRGEPAELRSIPEIVKGAASLHARELIQLGLLLLIATPIVRVAFSAIAFAFEGDKLYVVLTLTVLALLLYGLFGSGSA